MEPTIIGVKQLYRELPRITRDVQHGRSFNVVKHAKPIFTIIPTQAQNNKKYTLADLFAIRFKSGKTNLSRNVDKIVYGV